MSSQHGDQRQGVVLLSYLDGKWEAEVIPLRVYASEVAAASAAASYEQTLARGLNVIADIKGACREKCRLRGHALCREHTGEMWAAQKAVVGRLRTIGALPPNVENLPEDLGWSAQRLDFVEEAC